MTKAGDSKTKTAKAELIERVKLDLDYQISENLGRSITDGQLLEILGKYFENTDSIDISNPDILLKVKDDYGGFDDIKLSDLYNGAIITKGTICFNGKNVNNVTVGDDFTIGIRKKRAEELEKFRVIKKEGNIITGIAHYNITLDNEYPIQKFNAPISEFATSGSINSGRIDMNSNGIVIQKYILKYNDTLIKLGAKNTTTRVVEYDDIYGLDANLMNPSQAGNFWIGGMAQYAGSGRYQVFELKEGRNSFGRMLYYYKLNFGNGVRTIVEVDTTDLDYTTNVADVNKYKEGTVEQKLVDSIYYEDYGKSINYNVTVGGQTLNNWKVLYNDGNHIYIILGDYLEANLMPNGNNVAKDPTERKYEVWSGRGGAQTLRDWLNNNDIWSSFASGIEGATAKGSPTVEQIQMALNKVSTETVDNNNSLVIPRQNIYEGCSGYWLNKYYEVGSSTYLSHFDYNGSQYDDESATAKGFSVRPVVCLPSDIQGTVADTVTITE